MKVRLIQRVGNDVKGPKVRVIWPAPAYNSTVLITGTYPGVVVVFGMGLLWKRATNRAALWTTIATIPAKESLF